MAQLAGNFFVRKNAGANCPYRSERVIAKQSLSPSKEFEIENIPMLVGLNTLTITATDINNNVGLCSIDILNTSEENSVDVVLDTGDDD